MGLSFPKKKLCSLTLFFPLLSGADYHFSRLLQGTAITPISSITACQLIPTFITPISHHPPLQNVVSCPAAAQFDLGDTEYSTKQLGFIFSITVQPPSYRSAQEQSFHNFITSPLIYQLSNLSPDADNPGITVPTSLVVAHARKSHSSACEHAAFT